MAGKQLKTFYFKGNFGDILTPYLLEMLHPDIRVSHVEHGSIDQAEFIGIGSIMEWALTIKTPVTIWGSGLMLPDSTHIAAPNHNLLAVRGKLTAERLGFQGALGDPGLLVSTIIPARPKKYKYGFIPHYVDKKLPSAQKILELPDVRLIDVVNCNQEDSAFCQQFLEQVAECETIISSSLHGVVVADAFRIPNAHLMLSDGVYGNNYKFRDYYSAFDQEHQMLDLRNVTEANLDSITVNLLDSAIANYKAKPNLESLQDDLILSLRSWLSQG
ncbi:polysaccharide pyruvyl transferase family protein [Candidatus Saccharibacteria bacterium]|nr:polysaccharide pyruvyl transferase family protein [Candidatus Saccharibacteria bacterium]